MSRWLINPIYLARNCRDALTLVRSGDRWAYLRWLYHDKFFGRNTPHQQTIGFRFPAPTGELNLRVEITKVRTNLCLAK